jgi:S-adenosylmethionine hydrolase
VDLANKEWFLGDVSRTFHGRDVFAPVAARLAAGAPVADAGDPLDPEELARIELPPPRREDGALVAHAVAVDGYGNVALNAGHGDLAGAGVRLGDEVEVEAGGARTDARFVTTFADVEPGRLLVYEDSYGWLAVALNRGDAAAALDVALDSEVRVGPRR